MTQATCIEKREQILGFGASKAAIAGFAREDRA
jgi:hypothetical protein